MSNLQDRAQILVEVLPYIRQFYGKVVVVKCGGELMAEERIKENISEDLTLMRFVGIKPVIVHGGGLQVTQFMEKLGKKAEFSEGMRKTDEETIEIVEMVLGKINKDLVNLINRAGGKAAGLSGKDGSLIVARKITSSSGEDLGMVGEAASINPSIIKVLDGEGFIPVIAPLAVTDEGVTLNINADMIAAEIAIALKAEKIIILTNKPGIMRDINDENSLISTIPLSEIEALIEKGIIHGGMVPKVKACKRALEEGINKTHIIDGRIPHSMLLEIFTDKGIGTQLVKG
ncbi:MAG TPA: acetylglutamate kinase [Candidatus Omnitrophica bacterium]|nr:acetylglutamate kinase [Candidatus Omnitrophota bacterium]